jgi:hypothetical protein
MLSMVDDRLGSADWDSVRRALSTYVDNDGTLWLPSMTLCIRAVTYGAVEAIPH